MNKFLSLIILTVGLLGAGSLPASAAVVSSAAPDSVLLHYRSGSILLYDTYMNNDVALSRLNSIVNANRAAIVDGRYHLAIYGYIPFGSVNNKRAVNTASIQASVIRAYLKTRLRIPHTCFTFDIDTTQNRANMVQLQLVRNPIQAYANTAIHYSESRNLGSIASAFAQYKNGVPYTSYYMVLAKRDALGMGGNELYAINGNAPYSSPYTSKGIRVSSDADSSNYESFETGAGAQIEPESTTVAGYYIKNSDGSFRAAPKDALAEGTHVIYVTSDDGAFAPASASQLIAFAPASGVGANANALESYGLYQKEGLIRTEPYADARGDMAAREYPIVGVKTNLAYWAVAMPNAELEFYIGKGFSLNFEGSYAWLSSVLKENKAYYIWGAGAEFRVWLKHNRQFSGLYFGVYGHAGQYDFKFNEIGDQGDYFGGGVSVGYMLPLGKRFNMEFGLGLGYVGYTNTKYKWDSALKQNVFISKTPQSWIGPTKLKVALVWKF